MLPETSFDVYSRAKLRTDKQVYIEVRYASERAIVSKPRAEALCRWRFAALTFFLKMNAERGIEGD